MHTSDLVAQVAAIAVASVGMVTAWLITRHCPDTAPDPLPAPGDEPERPS
ncbi:hypothetical protein ACWEDZ_02030 [Streptomyces sp. NPDC005047]